jgi:hypothetical protein
VTADSRPIAVVDRQVALTEPVFLAAEAAVQLVPEAVGVVRFAAVEAEAHVDEVEPEVVEVVACRETCVALAQNISHLPVRTRQLDAVGLEAWTEA